MRDSWNDVLESQNEEMDDEWSLFIVKMRCKDQATAPCKSYQKAL